MKKAKKKEILSCNNSSRILSLLFEPYFTQLGLNSVGMSLSHFVHRSQQVHTNSCSENISIPTLVL